MTNLFANLFTESLNYSGTGRSLAVPVGEVFSNSPANRMIYNTAGGPKKFGWEAWTRTRIIRSRI
jgi:hypothetical protein